MQFSIQQKNLKSVSLAMAVKDIRYYLQGVYFETNGAETRIVATDGHRLHMVIEENEGKLVSDVTTFIMPLDMVKRCVMAKGIIKNPSIEITYSPENGKIEARLPDGSSLVQFATDGKFPDYRRIIPALDQAEPQVAIFNPDYVSDAVKGFAIYAEIGGKTPPTIGIRPRGASCGVLCCENYLAVVMPLRGDVSPMPAPKFTEALQTPVKLSVVAA